jgi:hypothetical protein
VKVQWIGKGDKRLAELAEYKTCRVVATCCLGRSDDFGGIFDSYKGAQLFLWKWSVAHGIIVLSACISESR